MILHYSGKYSGDENRLPQREHPSNFVPFKEPKNMKQLALISNVGCVITIILLGIPYLMLTVGQGEVRSIWNWGFPCAVLTLFPHELLHAICFKKDVYLYTNFKQGLLFVVGTEDMSRGRFILMSLLPNIVFGFLSYIIFLIHPPLTFLGSLGLLCVGMGFGDYINVFNAVRQVPHGAKIYLSGMHSYWYMDT